MINISELMAGDIGEYVIYTDGVGETQRGRLKSWNQTTVFAVFKCNNEWERFKDFTGIRQFRKTPLVLEKKENDEQGS